MNYISIDFALRVHDFVIEKSGGLYGVKDRGQLDSVLTHIQNDDYYLSFEDKLTHLIYSIIQFHMFVDGNKRTAISLGAYFMNLNHYTYATDDFIEAMEDIVVEVAEGTVDKKELLKIVTKLLK